MHQQLLIDGDVRKTLITVTEHYTTTIIINLVGDLKNTPMVDIWWNPSRNGADTPQRVEALFEVKEFTAPQSRFFAKHTSMSMSTEVVFQHKKQNKFEEWWNDYPKLHREENFLNSHRAQYLIFALRENPSEISKKNDLMVRFDPTVGFEYRDSGVFKFTKDNERLKFNLMAFDPASDTKEFYASIWQTRRWFEAKIDALPLNILEEEKMTFGFFKRNFQQNKRLLNIPTTYTKFDETTGSLVAPELAFSSIEIDPSEVLIDDEHLETKQAVIWVFNLAPYDVQIIEKTGLRHSNGQYTASLYGLYDSLTGSIYEESIMSGYDHKYLTQILNRNEETPVVPAGFMGRMVVPLN